MDHILKDITILLVDDSRIQRELTASKLRKKQIKVIQAENGVEALDIVGRESVDLILLDCFMPGMDGFDVLRNIRPRYDRVDLPIIMLTSLQEDGKLEDAFELGANDYITKPFRLSTGFARVRSCLEGVFAQRKLKESHDEIKRAHEIAKEANAAKSVFLAKMSHEIRTPMNSIIGMADIVLETALTKDQEYPLRVLRKAGDHLLSIVNDVLDLSKIESKKVKLENKPFSLVAIIDDAIQLMSLNAHNKHIELTSSVQLDFDIQVLGDAPRFRQILVNFLSNAIKFTPSGGEVHLYAGINRDTGEFEFAIHDSGIGIEDDQLSEILESFGQAEEFATRLHGGLGLGLTICKEFIDLMQGRLTIESSVGNGSVFKFELPLEKAKSFDFSRPSFGMFRCLVCTNQKQFGQGLLHDLGRFGIETLYTSKDHLGSALETMVQTSSAKIDLLIYDYMNPKDFDWLKTFNLIANFPIHVGLSMRSPDRPIVVEKARNLGIRHFLNRPHSRNDLHQFFSGIHAQIFSGNMIQDRRNMRQPGVFPIASRQAMGNTQQPHEGLPKNQLPIVNSPLTGGPNAPRGNRVFQSSGHGAAPVMVMSRSQAQRYLNILAVDDAADNLWIVKAYLRKFPCRIETAENGLEAVEKFRSESFDIILMDMQMAIMDGYEAVRKIRLYEKESAKGPVKIVALTAFSQKEQLDRCLEVGCDKVLTKPLLKDNLMKTINSYNPRD